MSLNITSSTGCNWLIAMQENSIYESYLKTSLSNTCTLVFSPLKLEYALKKHVPKYGFVKSAFTFIHDSHDCLWRETQSYLTPLYHFYSLHRHLGH